MNLRSFFLSFSFLLLTAFLPAQDQPIDTTTYDGLMDQSFIAWDNEEFENALRLTDKAIDLSERSKGNTSQDYLTGRMSRGSLLVEMGKVEQALTEQQATIDLWKLHQDTTTVDYGENNYNLGNTYLLLSKYPEAIVALQKALQLIPRTDDIYWMAFSDLQTIYGNMGRYQEVLKNYRPMVAHLENKLQEVKDAPDSPEKENNYKDAMSGLGESLANQSILFYNLGNVKDAIPSMERGLSLIEEVEGKTGDVYLDYSPVLVVLYRAIGQMDRALALGNEIWQTSLEVNASPAATAFVGEAISSIYIQQAQFPQALTYALKADSLYVVGEKSTSYERSSLLLNIGKVYNETNQHDEALEVLAKSAEIITTLASKQHLIYQLGLLQIAEIKGKQGKYAEQLVILEEAKMELGRQFKSNINYYSAILGANALAHEQLGDIEKATAEYAELNKLFTQQTAEQFDFFSETEQITWQKQLLGFQHKALSFALRHTDSPTMAGTAFDLHTLFKGLAFGNRKLLLERVRHTPNEDLQELYQEWVDTRKIVSNQYRQPGKHSPLLDSVEQRAQTLEQQLARQSQPFKQARKTISSEEISKTLSADEALIEFTFFNDYVDGNHMPGWTIAAFVLRGDQQSPTMVGLLTDEDLAGINSTKKLYAAQSTKGQSNLRKLVYEPLSIHLKGIKRLHYAPAGFLHRVNFGAIPVSDTETISDRFALHQISHAGDLLTSPKKALVDRQRTAVLFGGIDYEPSLETDIPIADSELSRSFSPDSTALRAYKDGNWDQLSWTTNEVADIEQLLLRKKYNTTLLKGSDATEEAFKQLSKNGVAPRVLHLATHGYFFPKANTLKKKDGAKTGFESAKHPLVRSGLILAGANRAWRGEATPEGKEDGILTAYEIAEMDLSNTELVVLSACETGLGDIDGSEGVFGLQRAFKMAGAKYVLMSLWNVKDKKTYEFMGSFYRSWNKGLSIPEAYQKAQSEMRTKYALPFAPRNWAGFVLLH